MLDSYEFLYLLEQVGLLLLNGSLLHHRLVCALNINNNKLSNQHFRIVMGLYYLDRQSMSC